MTTKETLKIIENAVKTYGPLMQMVVCIEELAELQKELTKCIRENVHKYDLPPAGEWAVNVRYGGEKYNDFDYYYRGYYMLEVIKGGYRYTVREPYCWRKHLELDGDL